MQTSLRRLSSGRGAVQGHEEGAGRNKQLRGRARKEDWQTGGQWHITLLSMFDVSSWLLVEQRQVASARDKIVWAGKSAWRMRKAKSLGMRGFSTVI